MAKKYNKGNRKTQKTIEESKNIGSKTTAATVKKRAESVDSLYFDKQNYIYIGLGLLLIVVGFLLMSGGAMPDDNTWDPNIIYSSRRITLAPFVVLCGLITVIYAIFKK